MKPSDSRGDGAWVEEGGWRREGGGGRVEEGGGMEEEGGGRGETEPVGMT